MSVIQFLMENVNMYLLCFLIVAIYVLSAVSGLIIMQKYLPHEKCKNHNDVAGFSLRQGELSMPFCWHL
jgi:general stress protein CsbA